MEQINNLIRAMQVVVDMLDDLKGDGIDVLMLDAQKREIQLYKCLPRLAELLGQQVTWTKIDGYGAEYFGRASFVYHGVYFYSLVTIEEAAQYDK